MRNIFFNNELESEFRKKGYVQIPLLNEDEIEYFLNAHQKLAPERKEEFYTSIWHEDEKYRIDVNKTIESVIPTKLNSILIDYNPLFANFMVKKRGDKSSLDFHQDWTFVDESQYTAINVWIPLVDTNKMNGALRVVKGSHKFEIPYRGRNIEGPFWKLNSFIRLFFSDILEVKKGHAVLFDERLIHGSFQNYSEKERVAISNVMIPQEAEILHFSISEGNKLLNKQVVEKDFFTSYALNDDITKYGRIEQQDFINKRYSLPRFAWDYFLANFVSR
jgi:hypothetical protein